LREEGVRDVRSVSPAHLFAFARALAEENAPPLAAWTLNAYLGTVRRFFAFLYAQGVILLDPARELSVSRPRGLPRPVPSEARVRRLMNASFLKTPVALRDRAILETLYGTGIRRGECQRLDLTDVDLRGGTLFVREGKGKKDRVLPLLGRARGALDAYLKDGREALAKRKGERALFLSRCGGKRLSELGLGLVVTRHQGAAKLSPHLLRHAFATHLLAGGASIRHVQALLGHRRIQTTALYTRVDVRELRRVIERAHPLFRNSRVSRRYGREPSRAMLPRRRQGRARRRVE
jgi:integrase/recombinase XerD